MLVKTNAVGSECQPLFMSHCLERIGRSLEDAIGQKVRKWSYFNKIELTN
jgi:hypothetical protein